jgi:hypothetical protein
MVTIANPPRFRKRQYTLVNPRCLDLLLIAGRFVRCWYCCQFGGKRFLYLLGVRGGELVLGY